MPSAVTAKLATGLAGLTTLSTTTLTYIIPAPDNSPRTAPAAAFTQPLTLPNMPCPP